MAQRTKRPFSLFGSKNKQKKGATPYPRGLLPAGGRSSVDDTLESRLNKISNYFGIANPLIPTATIEYINLLSVVDPDVSKAIMIFQSTVNTGHTLLIESEKEKNTETALKELNALSSTLFKTSPGIDGVVNLSCDQLCRGGASSIESTLNDNFSGVKNIIPIPVGKIRARLDNGEWHYFQQTSYNHNTSNALGLVPLNPITYRFYSLQNIDNSPYPIPPLLPVLSEIADLNKIKTSVKQIIDNKKLFGLNIAKIPEPEFDYDDTSSERTSKYQAYIREIVNLLGESYESGFLGVPADIQVENFQSTGNIDGIDKIITNLERRMFSGLKSDPGLHGTHTARTETFLSVIYRILIHFAKNIRRIIKRRIEEIYMLHLNLCGIEVDSVKLKFNPDSSLKPQQDAVAEKIRVETVINKLSHGIIKPARAAQELGYNEFADEGLLKRKLQGSQTLTTRQFVWSQESQQYLYLKPVHQVSGIDSFKKDDGDSVKAKRVETKLRKYVSKYLATILPYFAELEADVLDFATVYAKENIEEISEKPEALTFAVKKYIEEHPDYKNIEKNSWFRDVSETYTVNAGKEYFENDFSAFPGGKPGVKFVFGEGDIKAMKFYAGLDNFHFSKFIGNQDFGSEINHFITKFLERGEAAYGNWTNAVEKEFQRLFGNALKGDFQLQMRRIINTSMAHIRGRSFIKQLDQAGFKYSITRGLDTACDICLPLIGEKTLIKVAMKRIQAFENAKSNEAALAILKASNVTLNEVATKDNIENALIKKGKHAPFHVHCYCYEEGYFEKQ